MCIRDRRRSTTLDPSLMFVAAKRLSINSWSFRIIDGSARSSARTVSSILLPVFFLLTQWHGIKKNYRIFCFVFFISSKNAAKPLSVSGWFIMDFMTDGGAVITSAPIRALSNAWFTVRIDAAKI